MSSSLPNLSDQRSWRKKSWRFAFPNLSTLSWPNIITSEKQLKSSIATMITTLKLWLNSLKTSENSTKRWIRPLIRKSKKLYLLNPPEELLLTWLKWTTDRQKMKSDKSQTLKLTNTLNFSKSLMKEFLERATPDSAPYFSTWLKEEETSGKNITLNLMDLKS